MPWLISKKHKKDDVCKLGPIKDSQLYLKKSTLNKSKEQPRSDSISCQIWSPHTTNQRKHCSRPKCCHHTEINILKLSKYSWEFTNKQTQRASTKHFCRSSILHLKFNFKGWCSFKEERKHIIHLVWTSSTPLILFMTQDMPAFTPVITAKLRACTKGPPARAYKSQW